MRTSLLPTLFKGNDLRTDPFLALRKQIDALFDDFGFGMMPSWSGDDVLPVRINLSETETDFRITAELPGIEPDDVEIEILGDRLMISGEKHAEHTEKDEKEGRTYHRVERMSGAFRRAIELPFEIDADKVAAEFRNGVLTITVPKPEAVTAKAKKVKIAVDA